MPPKNGLNLSPSDRRREVASILARGVIRWHKRAKTAGITDAQKSPPCGETRLELSSETPLSVGTRGLTGATPVPPPRSDGDER